MNLQKFAFSTLTFSLATTLAVAGFSESASAKKKGGRYDDSNNTPGLTFDALLERDNGDKIFDSDDDNNIGIFKDAIEIDFISIDKENDLKEGADLFNNGKDFISLSSDDPANPFNKKFNLSAKRQKDGLIQYQIYQGDDITPNIGIRFAPIAVSSLDSNLDFVNNIQNIIESSDTGVFGVEEDNGDFVDFISEGNAGVLGLAINKSITYNAAQREKFELDSDDFLKIERFGSTPSTSIPEPTTTLASIFALGFAGKFLRKSKKDNA